MKSWGNPDKIRRVNVILYARQLARDLRAIGEKVTDEQVIGWDPSKRIDARKRVEQARRDLQTMGRT